MAVRVQEFLLGDVAGKEDAILDYLRPNDLILASKFAGMILVVVDQCPECDDDPAEQVRELVDKFGVKLLRWN